MEGQCEGGIQQVWMVELVVEKTEVVEMREMVEMAEKVEMIAVVDKLEMVELLEMVVGMGQMMEMIETKYIY